MCPGWLAGPKRVGRTHGAERVALLSSDYKADPALLEEPKPRWNFQIKSQAHSLNKGRLSVVAGRDGGPITQISTNISVETCMSEPSLDQPSPINL